MGLSLCNENLVFAGPEVQGGREPAFWFCWVSKTSKSGFPGSGVLRRDSGLFRLPCSSGGPPPQGKWVFIGVLWQAAKVRLRGILDVFVQHSFSALAGHPF